MVDRRQLRREHVAAGAIYGTVLYLTILVLLQEDRTDPEDAITILLGTAFVFWLAHIYAHLVPLIAAHGGLRTEHFRETAWDQVGVLGAVVVPTVPLVLATLGVLGGGTGLRTAIIASLLALAAFAVREARAAGLGWGRSLLVAMVLLVAGIGLVWLELSLHD